MILFQHISSKNISELQKLFADNYDERCPNPKQEWRDCDYPKICQDETSEIVKKDTNSFENCTSGCFCKENYFQDPENPTKCLENKFCKKFTCDNGKTISLAETCNKINDCGDFSDEFCCGNSASEKCDFYRCTEKFDRFMCSGPKNNGACIDKKYVTSNALTDVWFSSIYDLYDGVFQQTTKS